MKHAQMAMWILTKFALIFFIVALFSILFIFERNERSLSCSSQTQHLADAIANRVLQVINSPVEDEQRSYVFDMGLVLGQEDIVRYNVNVTYIEIIGKAQKLRIEVNPPSVRDCSRASMVDFGNKTVTLDSAPTRPIASQTAPGYIFKTVMLSPSDRDELQRSRYLIVIKCGAKSWPPQKYLFVSDCTRADPQDCMNFDTSIVDASCGYH